MACHIREINPTSLEEMQRNVVSVEANLLINKSKRKVEKRVTIKEETSSSPKEKFDNLIRNVDKMVERMSILESQSDNQIHNPNFQGQQQQP